MFLRLKVSKSQIFYFSQELKVFRYHSYFTNIERYDSCMLKIAALFTCHFM